MDGKKTIIIILFTLFLFALLTTFITNKLKPDSTEPDNSNIESVDELENIVEYDEFNEESMNQLNTELELASDSPAEKYEPEEELISEWIPPPADEFIQNYLGLIETGEKRILLLESKSDLIPDEDKDRYLDLIDRIHGSVDIIKQLKNHPAYIDTDEDGFISYSEFNYRTYELSTATYTIRHKTFFDSMSFDEEESNSLITGQSFRVVNQLPFDTWSNYPKESGILIVVEAGIFDDLKDILQKYIENMEQYTEFDVIDDIFPCDDCSIEDIKNTLIEYYNDGHDLPLAGTIFIGNLPSAWFHHLYSPSGVELFPIDLFFMDLDGKWSYGLEGCFSKKCEIHYTDAACNNDYCVWELDSCINPIRCELFDKSDCMKHYGNCEWFEEKESQFTSHKGDIIPEIFLGRIQPHIEDNEITDIINYLQKVIDYRNSPKDTSTYGIEYLDDDFVKSDKEKKRLLLIADNMQQITDPVTTNNVDYAKRISEDLQSSDDLWSPSIMYLHCHSLAYQHSFVVGPRSKKFTNDDMKNIVPKINFYFLHTCLSNRFTYNDFLGGNYLFLPGSKGLVSIGNTKVSWSNFDSILKALRTRSFGESIIEYFKSYRRAYEQGPVGINIIGDPTLRFPDRDFDRVSDAIDNCPEIYNPMQRESEEPQKIHVSSEHITDHSRLYETHNSMEFDEYYTNSIYNLFDNNYKTLAQFSSDEHIDISIDLSNPTKIKQWAMLSTNGVKWTISTNDYVDMNGDGSIDCMDKNFYSSFDSTQGYTINDLSGQCNSLRLFSASISDNGKIHRSSSFDGEDEYASASVADSLANTESLSISFWVYPYENPAEDNINTLISIFDSFDISLIGTGKDYSNIYVDITWDTWEINSRISASEWSYITLIYDKDTNQLRFYKKGILQDQIDYTAGLVHWNYPLYLSPGPFLGKLDEVKIYNRVLTETEVQDLFNNQQVSEGLSIHYSFDPEPEFEYCEKQDTGNEIILAEHICDEKGDWCYFDAKEIYSNLRLRNINIMVEAVDEEDEFIHLFGIAPFASDDKNECALNPGSSLHQVYIGPEMIKTHTELTEEESFSYSYDADYPNIIEKIIDDDENTYVKSDGDNPLSFQLSFPEPISIGYFRTKALRSNRYSIKVTGPDGTITDLESWNCKKSKEWCKLNLDEQIEDIKATDIAVTVEQTEGEDDFVHLYEFEIYSFSPNEIADESDEIGDICDPCPYTFDPDDIDSDSDGAYDGCDNCPEDYNPFQEDSDGDEFGDACDPEPEFYCYDTMDFKINKIDLLRQNIKAMTKLRNIDFKGEIFNGITSISVQTKENGPLEIVLDLKKSMYIDHLVAWSPNLWSMHWVVLGSDLDKPTKEQFRIIEFTEEVEASAQWVHLYFVDLKKVRFLKIIAQRTDDGKKVSLNELEVYGINPSEAKLKIEEGDATLSSKLLYGDVDSFFDGQRLTTAHGEKEDIILDVKMKRPIDLTKINLLHTSDNKGYWEIFASNSPGESTFEKIGDNKWIGLWNEITIRGSDEYRYYRLIGTKKNDETPIIIGEIEFITEYNDELC
ncbi:MAG: hypothetical protein KKF44_10355 [Nanoarchaeota archaeon]|nr:hypothetical protein [Nanoarchaeota archaeon]